MTEEMMVIGYEQFFQEADTDRDGRLTITELTDAMKKNGYTGSDEQILAFFKSVIKTDADFINLDDFKEAMKNMPTTYHRDAVLRCTFRAFDKDGNGEIDRKEFQQVFLRVNKQLTENQTTELMKVIDLDQSGTINYEEFIASLDSFKD